MYKKNIFHYYLPNLKNYFKSVIKDKVESKKTKLIEQIGNCLRQRVGVNQMGEGGQKV